MITQKAMRHLANRLWKLRPPPGELRHLWLSMVKSVAIAVVPIKQVGVFFDLSGYDAAKEQPGEVSEEKKVLYDIR